MTAPLLLAYQSAWVREAAPVAAYRKSRRVGISYTTGYLALLHSALEGRGDVWYQTYSHEAAKEFLTDVRSWAERVDAALVEHGETLLDLGSETDPDTGGRRAVRLTAFQAVFANGRRITAMPGTPRVWRSKGRPRDLGIIDEAAWVDDLAAIMQAAFAFVLTGGAVRIISSAGVADDPFEAFCGDLRAGRRDGALHETYFDDALAAGYYREVVAPANGWAATAEAEAEYRERVVRLYAEHADQELHGVALSAARRWLSDEEIRGCEHPDAQRPALHGGGRWAVGIDIARRRDLWVAVVVEDVHGVLWVREMQEERNLPFWARKEPGHDSQERRVEGLIDSYGRSRLLRIGTDQTGMGEAVTEGYQRRWGDAVEGVLLTESRRLDLAAGLREAFRARRLRIPPRPELRRDLRSMGDTGSREAPRLAYVGDERGRKVSGEHADRFWALAIAVDMAGREPAETGGEAVTGGWGLEVRRMGGMAAAGGANAIH